MSDSPKKRGADTAIGAQGRDILHLVPRRGLILIATAAAIGIASATYPLRSTRHLRMMTII